LGKSQLKRSLGSDHTKASREVGAVVTEFKRILHDARQALGTAPGSPAWITAQAKLLAQEPEPEERFDLLLDPILETYPNRGPEDPADSAYDPPDDIAQAIQAWHRIIAGRTTLKEQIEAYLAEIKGHVRDQTREDKVRVYEAFTRWLRVDREPESIKKREAGSYVTNVLLRAGKASKTVESEIIQLSALWSWMESRGTVESNIWSKQTRSLPKSKRGGGGTSTARRAFTEAELLRLFSETDTSDPIWSASALGLLAALRIEESCQLLVKDVHDDHITIQAGKSNAAVRDVPIVKPLKPILDRLVATTTDKFVLPGLLSGGRDDKRSVLLAKRAAWNLRKVLKITDPTVVADHSLRHAFINRCEIAKAPENLVKLIVGHSRGDSITFGAPWGLV
jgi:integrase